LSLAVFCQQKKEKTVSLKTILCFLVVAVAMLFASSAAQAATTYTAGCSRGQGACGHASFHFAGVNNQTLTQIRLDVKDTRCDSNDVYIQLEVHHVNHAAKPSKLQGHHNHNGCHGPSQSWLIPQWQNRQGAIESVTIRVCISDWFADTCYTRSVDNPNV
jgi:hypothetical protein